MVGVVRLRCGGRRLSGASFVSSGRIDVSEFLELGGHLCLESFDEWLVGGGVGEVVELFGIVDGVEQFDAALCGFAVLDVCEAMFSEQESLAHGCDAEGCVADFVSGLFEHPRDVLALDVVGGIECAEFGECGVEVEEFDERVADAGLLSGHADDQRHGCRFISEADLGPEVVFAEVVTVVAGEDDDGVVIESCFVECIEDLADHGVHVGDRGVVACDGFFLASDVHLHIEAGLVVDARLGDIVPIAIEFLGQHHFAKRFEGRVVVSWCDEGDVRANESDPEPERLIAVFLSVVGDQLSGLGGGFSIRVHQVVSVGFDDDKRVATDGGFLSVGVVFECFAVAGRFPFGALAVESFGP